MKKLKLKPCPSLWTLHCLLVSAGQNTAEIDGEWVPARPVGYIGLMLRERFRIAWLVFKGRADAVLWPKQQ